MSGPGPITAVTVVYEAEQRLLEVQAQSLARFAAPELVSSVIVIDNSRHGLSRRNLDRLAERYGPHRRALRVLPAGEVADLPAAGGWHTQQILKLEVARLVRTSHYLLLDAKNDLVADLTPDALFDSQGRAKVRAYSFADHPHRARLERTLTYLGLDPQDHIDHFPATVTPYLIDTELAREVVTGVVEQSGRPFGAEFVAAGLTEFFLYGGWALRGGAIGTRITLTDDPAAAIWPGAAADDARVAEVLEAARESAVLSVHREAWRRLSPQSRERLAAFWAERGLFDTPEEAAASIRAITAQTRRARWALLGGRVKDRAMRQFARPGRR